MQQSAHECWLRLLGAPIKTSDPATTTTTTKTQSRDNVLCRSKYRVLCMVPVCSRRRTAVVIPSTLFRSVPSPDVACDTNCQRSTSLSLVFAHRELNKCVGGSLCATRRVFLRTATCAAVETRPYRRSWCNVRVTGGYEVI